MRNGRQMFARLFGFLCIFGLGVMESHAEANSNALLCRNIELSRGIIGHAEKLCRSQWIYGTSWLALALGANQCADKGIHDNDNFLGYGFKLFDSSAKTLGLDAACEQLDILLQETNKLAASYPPDEALFEAISNVVLSVRETDALPQVEH